MIRRRFATFGGAALAAVALTAGLVPDVAAQATYSGAIYRAPAYAGVPFGGAIPGFTPGYSPHSYGPLFNAPGPGSIQYYFPAYSSGTIGSIVPGYSPPPAPPTRPAPVVVSQYQPAYGSMTPAGLTGLETFPLGGSTPRFGDLKAVPPAGTGFLRGEGAGGTQAPGRGAALPPRPAGGAARFTVRLPEGAQLWVENHETRQSGPVRLFHSPANLVPGQTYEYTFRARWEEAGRPVTRERVVPFTAGGEVAVDLTPPAPASAPKDGAR
jgi:uncharacterized protein (TIGR03000 family)